MCYSAEASTQKGRRMHHNMHFETRKLKQKFWKGTVPPKPFPNEEGTPIPTIPHPILSAPAATLSLCLRCSTCLLPQLKILDMPVFLGIRRYNFHPPMNLSKAGTYLHAMLFIFIVQLLDLFLEYA